MKVLALSPHTDDVEYGAGGFIAKLVDEGHDIRVIAFSLGNDETGAESCEFYNAMNALGISNDRVYARGLETRTFSNHRQLILDCLCRDYEWKPDLVLCPSKNDFHQDHRVITWEAIRAFRTRSILGYIIPWSAGYFDQRFFVELSVVEVNRKMDALKCYESQWLKRHYMTEKGVEAILTVNGDRIGVPWAEAFEVIRWIY